MGGRRTLTIDLTDEQADTLHSLAFLNRERWSTQARRVLADWLDASAFDPHVAAAKRAKRRHQSGLRVVAPASTGREKP